jgi:hypothetical protein
MDDLALRLTLERRLRVTTVCRFYCIHVLLLFLCVTCWYLISLCLFLLVFGQFFCQIFYLLFLATHINDYTWKVYINSERNYGSIVVDSIQVIAPYLMFENFIG